MGLQHAGMGLRRRSPKKHNLVESECWDVGNVAAGQRSRSAPSANDAGPWIREGAPQIQRERERAAARPLLLSLLSVHVFFFQLEVAELRSSFPSSRGRAFFGAILQWVRACRYHCSSYVKLPCIHRFVHSSPPHITLTPAACEVRDGDYKLLPPRCAAWNPKTIPSRAIPLRHSHATHPFSHSLFSNCSKLAPEAVRATIRRRCESLIRRPTICARLRDSASATVCHTLWMRTRTAAWVPALRNKEPVHSHKKQQAAFIIHRSGHPYHL
jgi:hypothetical protein